MLYRVCRRCMSDSDPAHWLQAVAEQKDGGGDEEDLTDPLERRLEAAEAAGDTRRVISAAVEIAVVEMRAQKWSRGEQWSSRGLASAGITVDESKAGTEVVKGLGVARSTGVPDSIVKLLACLSTCYFYQGRAVLAYGIMFASISLARSIDAGTMLQVSALPQVFELQKFGLSSLRTVRGVGARRSDDACRLAPLCLPPSWVRIGGSCLIGRVPVVWETADWRLRSWSGCRLCVAETIAAR